MLNKVCIAGMALMLAAPGAIAQDLPTTQLQDHGQVVLQDSMTRSMLRQNSNRGVSRGSPSKTAATCANKGRAAANLGANHPKVRRLYQLCAQAGY